MLNSKAFSSCLIGDAAKWFKSLPAYIIATYNDLKKKFFDRWQEKDPMLLNNALMTIKISENTTIDELDSRFDGIVKEFPAYCKPVGVIIQPTHLYLVNLS